MFLRTYRIAKKAYFLFFLSDTAHLDIQASLEEEFRHVAASSAIAQAEKSWH